MAPFPAHETGILLTHFIVSEDIARSYTQKLWMRVKRKAAYLPG